MNYQIGAFGQSAFDGVCSSVYVVMKTRRDAGDDGFVRWLLSAREFQRFAQSHGNGILDHRRSIGWGTIKNLPVPVPHVATQARIARALDAQTSKIDALIAKAQQFIELSKERRAALITAAVTGQIDVRETAA